MRTLFLLSLMACEVEGSDVDTGDPENLPDIEGSYVVAPLIEVTGCETIAPDATWLEGAMEITGEPEDLLFTFEGGEELPGAVDAAFTFSADGTVDKAPLAWVVLIDGLAFIGDETWQLDGDLEATLTDSTAATDPCTLTGRLEAEQIPP